MIELIFDHMCIIGKKEHIPQQALGINTQETYLHIILYIFYTQDNNIGP